MAMCVFAICREDIGGKRSLESSPLDPRYRIIQTTLVQTVLVRTFLAINSRPETGSL